MEETAESKQDSLTNRDRNLRIIRYVLTAGITVFMCSLAFRNYSIWDDELFTLNLVDHPVSKMWGLIVDDLVHPPLYYYALKLFLIPYGRNHLLMIEASKYFSVLWISLLMLQGGYLIEKQHGSFAALLFTLFLCGHTSVAYSVEIRMYSMAMCFSAIAALYAEQVHLFHKKRDWIYLVIFSLLAAYTNYFGLIAVAMMWLWLLAVSVKRKQIKTWLIGALICGAAYAPWVITVLLNKKPVSDYSASITLSRAASILAFPFSCHNPVVSALFLTAVLLLMMIIIIKKKTDVFSLICVLNPVWIAVVCFISSVLFHKFVIGRYLLPGWGVFWVGIAIMASRLEQKRAITAVFAVLNVLALFFTFGIEQNDRVAARDLIETYLSEQMPVFTAEGVTKLLVFLIDDEIISADKSDNPSGRYYAYFWSEDWLDLKQTKTIIKDFPFSTNPIDIFSD